HVAASPAHLRVAWRDQSTDEAGFRIWRREPGGAWYLAGETAANATHFDDGGMQQSTAYEHKVAAFNATGESAAVESGATRTRPMQPHLVPELVVPEAPTYPGAPSAVALRNGTLLLAYSTGEVARRRTQINHSLWLQESRDHGKTWSAPRALFAGGTEISYGKPALV